MSQRLLRKTRPAPCSDEAPRLTQADFDRARFKVAGQGASKSEWQSAVRTKSGKLRINITLDAPSALEDADDAALFDASRTVDDCFRISAAVVNALLDGEQPVKV